MAYHQLFLVLVLSSTLAVSFSFSVQNFTCEACATLVKALHAVWDLEPTEDEVAHALSYLCKKYKVVDSVICDSITSTFEPEILYVAGQLFLQPHQLCGWVLKCGKPSIPYNTTWQIILPGNKPLPVTPPLPRSGSPTLRVLHISDIHYDPDYLPGSEAKCSSPLCCRDKPSNRSAVSDPAGYWGHFGNCDIPIHTVENLFKQLRDNFEFDMIYWTGDLPPHNIWSQTKPWNLEIYQNLTTLLLQYFPHTKIFSAVGNHESVPVDSFPATKSNIPAHLKNKWLYDKLAKSWVKFLPPSSTAEASIKLRASYMVKPYPGLRVISINTQYCDTLNFWLYLDDVDPDDTLQWLTNQLHEAEQNADAVHIIGHIPPGNTCLPTWSNNYYSIVNRFENTIRGQFFGHTHGDSFSVFYENADSSKRPTSYYSVGPSVTTFSTYNPAFKIYVVDGKYPKSSHTVLDAETYWMNITDANIRGTPQWQLEYKTKDAYGMSGMRPTDWDAVIKKFIRDPDLLQSYASNFYRYPKPSCTVNSKCQYDKLCEMRRAYTLTTHNLCDDLPSPTNPRVYSP